MTTAARLDLAIWRNDAIYEYPLRIVGPDLRGSGWQAQVRLGPDTPGLPLITLNKVATAVQGIQLVDALYVDGRFENEMVMRIDLAARQALPYAGEIGDSAQLAWAFQLNGVTRLFGDVIVLAHVIDSNAAPTNRPAGNGQRGPSAPAAGSTVTIAGQDVTVVQIETGDHVQALVARAGAAATRAEAAADRAEPHPPTDVAVPNGTSVEAVSNGISGASAAQPYAIRLGAKVYAGLSGLWQLRDYVDVTGIGRRSHIHHENPNNVDRQTLIQSYAFILAAQAKVEGVRVTVRNVRYAIHPDDNNGASKNKTPPIVNSRIEHLGNKEAAAQLPTDRNVAVGTGISSGQTQPIDRSVLIGPDGGGIGAHNNRDSTQPAHAVYRLSADVSHNGNRYAGASSLGSGQADTMTWIGCRLPGGRIVASEGWLSVNPNNQPARRLEIGMFLHGCSPLASVARSRGRALRIRSASAAAGSKVELVAGGSADAALFGATVEIVRGGAGLPAAIFGDADRSGIVVGPGQDNATLLTDNLGRALGDCSTVAKSSGFKFQGGATIVVTFDQNMTAKTDAQVLAIINAALGANGSADLYAVDDETFRAFGDGEEYHRNATATAILRKTALAWNGSKVSVRPMTSADDPSFFAGVAYEDILPGEGGRVKTGGYIALSDLSYIEAEMSRYDFIGDSNFASDPKRLQFLEGFGIDPAQAGRLKRGAGNLLRMVVPADTENNHSTVHQVA